MMQSSLQQQLQYFQHMQQQQQSYGLPCEPDFIDATQYWSFDTTLAIATANSPRSPKLGGGGSCLLSPRSPVRRHFRKSSSLSSGHRSCLSADTEESIFQLSWPLPETGILKSARRVLEYSPDQSSDNNKKDEDQDIDSEGEEDAYRDDESVEWTLPHYHPKDEQMCFRAPLIGACLQFFERQRDRRMMLDMS